MLAKLWNRTQITSGLFLYAGIVVHAHVADFGATNNVRLLFA